MKNIVFVLGGLCFLLAGVFAQNDASFFYQSPDQTVGNKDITTVAAGTEKTDIGKIVQTTNLSDENATTRTDTLMYKIRQYFRLTDKGQYDNASPATSYLKWILNMALGLVSFISLILVIFAFYLIFFDKGEEGVTKAKKILTGVAIALLIIGLSWIIVSFFFSLYSVQAVKNVG